MAIAKVENYNGAPALLIDGKVYPPMFATIRTVDGDVSRADEDYYRHLGESGIKIFFLICDTEWLKPGAFQLFKEEAELLLRAVPDAYIVMRLGMHAPPAWCKENPDETLTYSDGKKKKRIFVYRILPCGVYRRFLFLCLEKMACGCRRGTEGHP